MKMEYVANIRAELNGYPGPEKLVLKQGDFTDRYVDITMTKDGSPVQIGAGVSVQVNMEKPDGTQVMADENIEVLEDGTLKVQILPQMSAAAGSGHLEVALYLQGALLSTAVIDVLVYPSAISMVKVASSNEYQVLIEALAQIAPAIDAEEERKQAESERIQNEIVRQRQELKREQNTDAALEAVDFAVQDMIARRDSGEFDGEKGDTGPQGPQGIQGPQGPPGENGNAAVVDLSPGVFAVAVNGDGHLILTHNTSDPAPPLQVKDGHLKYIIGEA